MLPTEANSLLATLAGCVREFSEEWQAELDQVIGSALPDEAAVLKAKLDELLAENADLKKRPANK